MARGPDRLVRAHWESNCGDAATAAAVLAAVAPELADGPEGATCRLEQEGSLLHLHIEAGDLSTLRAAVASSIRLLDAAVQVARPETDKT